MFKSKQGNKSVVMMCGSPASWIPQPSGIHRAELERKAVDDIAEALRFD